MLSEIRTTWNGPTYMMMQPLNRTEYAVEMWVAEKWRRVPDTTYHNQNAAELAASWLRTNGGNLGMGQMFEYRVSPFTRNSG